MEMIGAEGGSRTCTSLSDNGFLSPLEAASPSLTKRYEPVFTRRAVVKVSLGLVTYQHGRRHLSPICNYFARDSLGKRRNSIGRRFCSKRSCPESVVMPLCAL